MNTVENGTLAVARLLMCALFVLDGWKMLVGAAATQAYFARYNLPLPAVVWVVAVVAQLGGGLAILLGLLTRPAAIVLAIWCGATALVAHTNFADSDMEIHFMKNLAMAGGFLCVAVRGAGAWSLDAAWLRRRHAAA
jgi:putative oxidoreductase